MTVSPRFELDDVSTHLFFDTTLIDLQMIRNITKGERDWNLKEETNRS